MIRLAVDAMGGDYAPKVVVDGMALFHARCPQSSFLLYGDEEKVLPLLKKHLSLQSVCEMRHTLEYIPADMKPSQALRALPQASMRLSLEAVASGQAHGAISAGNTGAYLALAKLILKTLPSIDRPAIGSHFSTVRGEVVFLDLGGTLEATPRNLVEYALMGDVFARRVLGISHPKVGLLNVGKEENKGGQILQQSFLLLKQSELNFIGFIEGDDIMSGEASVIVTDGFTGNIALKTIEGVTTTILSALDRSFSSSVRGKIARWVGTPFLTSVSEFFDFRLCNGALWLGLNGVAVKSRGGADAFGFSYAVETAYDMASGGIVSIMQESFEKNSFQTITVKQELQASTNPSSGT